MSEAEQKIIAALEAGGNAKQAAQYSGVGYAEVLQFISDNGGEAWIEELRGRPIFRAKQVIMNESLHDVKVAQWLLTHHKDSKNDWSDRTELTGKEGAALPSPIINLNSIINDES